MDGWSASTAAALPSACCLGLDLRLVAWDAEGLGVLEDVFAAFGDGRDVVAVKVTSPGSALVSALDAGPSVACEAFLL